MIKRYDSVALSAFVKHMLHSKNQGGEFQKNLLKAARDNVEFVRFFEDNLKKLGQCESIFDGEDEPPLFSEQLSEQEFINPPPDTVNRMVDTWHTLEKRDAGDPCLWAYINTRMVESNLITSAGIAGKGNGGSKGLACIDSALQGSAKELDQTARRFVRQLCGHPDIRGIREMYQNCGPARAWWKARIAEEMASATEEANDVHRALEIFKEKKLWDLFSEQIVSRRTVIGDINIRNGLLLFWAGKDSKSDFRIRVKTIRDLFWQIGRMSSWRALGYLGHERVYNVIIGEIIPLMPEDSSVSEDSMETE